MTWTFLRGASAGGIEHVERVEGHVDLPYPLAVDIAGRLLLQETANLLDLGAARLRVKKQVAELARVRLNVDGALGGSWVALEHEHLVLRATLLLDGVHGGGGLGNENGSSKEGTGKFRKLAEYMPRMPRKWPSRPEYAVGSRAVGMDRVPGDWDRFDSLRISNGGSGPSMALATSLSALPGTLGNGSQRYGVGRVIPALRNPRREDQSSWAAPSWERGMEVVMGGEDGWRAVAGCCLSAKSSWQS